jgi:hypothetical protein
MKKWKKNLLGCGIGLLLYIIIEQIFNIKVTDWVISLFQNIK